MVLRRFPRRVYQGAAVIALVAATQAAIVPAVGAGPAWLWAGVPVLGAAAAVLIVKSLPYENVKFP
jgi:hypothetical protein